MNERMKKSNCINKTFYIHSIFMFFFFFPILCSFTGDHPAAMYHEHRSAATKPYRDNSWWCSSTLLLLYCSILANLLPFVFIMCSFNSSTLTTSHCSSRRHSISVDANATNICVNSSADISAMDDSDAIYSKIHRYQPISDKIRNVNYN